MKIKKDISKFLKNFKIFLFNLLENENSKLFQVYQPISLVIVLASVILFLFDEFHGLHSSLYSLAQTMDIVASFLIGFEYIGRFYVSSDFIEDFKKNKEKGKFLAFQKALDKKIKWFLRPSSLIDLFSILPLYPPIRIIRIFVITLRLVRISVRVKEFYLSFFRIFFDIFTEVFIFIAFLITTFIALALILFSVEVENKSSHIHSIFDAFYLAFITALTIGYGDIVPKTDIGKVIAILIGINGLLMISIMTAIITSSLFRYIDLIKKGGIILKEMKNHVIIAGFTESSFHFISKLKNVIEHPRDIVLITTKALEDINIPSYVFYKHGDFVKESVLKEVNVEKADHIIIMPEVVKEADPDSIDARSILTAMIARDLNENAYITVQILKMENAAPFRRKRIANSILVSGEIIGEILLQKLK